MSEVRTAPKRLVDLNPRWFGVYGQERSGIGVMFDCPCQQPDCAWGGSIAITFSNPIDGGPPMAGSPTERLWRREGDTFETLTCSPSIHAVGHWHGWLRNGVLESC